MTLTLDAPAKINLTLEVLGRRADGYHELRMVMQTVSLYDRVTVTLGEPGKRVLLRMRTPDGGETGLPEDARNLAWKAAALFFRASGQPSRDVSVEIEKRIPAGAGLGGGSTDAAAVLRALNALTGAGIPAGTLADMSLPLGADVPFCVLGGTKLAQGIGEKLTALPALPACTILLCTPGFACLTGAVYAAYDASPAQIHPKTDEMCHALKAGDLTRIAALCANDLEGVVGAMHPEIGQIRETLRSCGAPGTAMTGSGSSVYGVFPDDTAAQCALTALQTRYVQTYPVHPA